jgi:carboxyl-terminal processing protease
LKYGVIYLPKFYIDFENKDGREMPEKIALEVETQSGTSRWNSDVRDDEEVHYHGSLDIAGLFIEQVPIVQIKSAGRKKEVLFDRDKKIEWDGPLNYGQ